MPPPNTPEEFFADEYRTAVTNAGRNRSQRFPNLPPHDEDSAESDEAGGGLDLRSHPNTSQSESRRNSIDRRMSPGRSRSRSRDSSSGHGSISVIASPPRRADMREFMEQYRMMSPSPSTVGPRQSDHAAEHANNPTPVEEQQNNSDAPSSTQAQDGTATSARQLRELMARHRARNASNTPTSTDTEGVSPTPATVPRLPGGAAREAEVSTAATQIRNGNGNGHGAPQLDGQSLVIRQQRNRSRTPKLDWHALEYIGTYDENLDCPICRAPLVKPQITTCFHIFCAKCLSQSLRHSNRCPIDRNPIQRFSSRDGSVPARPAPHIISNQLDNLQVRCPNRRCDYTSARSFIKEHYKAECAFTKIPCPDPCCDKLVTRRDSEEGSCLHKAVDCVYCGKPVELAALDDHYDTDCNQKELMCEHCLAAVPRHRHGTHVMGCAERRIECKFRTSGCSYTSKKKDFGDHERTCLYGMIMRMNRAHRADMDSMETVLQDSQDRVRKLEAEMAARPPQPPTPVPIPQSAATAAAQPPPAQQFYEYPSQHPNLQGHVYSQTQPALDPHHDLSSYYDAAAAGDTLAQANGGGGTRPGTPPTGGPLVHNASTAGGTSALASDENNSDDRMNRIVAYIDIFDAKVENLERYLGEVDARQAQLFINELGPLKEQILEMRNTMGHISMYVRWLMESFRQTTKRSVGLRSGGGGGAGGAGDDGVANGHPAAPPNGPTAVAPGANGAAGASAAAGPSANAGSAGLRGPPTVLRVPTGGMVMPTRRMSDRENPPRL